MDYIERNYKALIDFIQMTKSRFENLCIPLKPNGFFDVVCFCSQDSRNLNSIKIVCTETKNPAGSYVANLTISGGYENRTEKKKHFDSSRCHYLFIWTPEAKYLIPTSEITQKKALVLSGFEKFRL